MCNSKPDFFGATGFVLVSLKFLRNVVYAGQIYGYLPPLTKLAAQTEFSQLEKDCSGSSKDAHGLKFER